LGLKFRGPARNGTIEGNVFSHNRNAVSVSTKYAEEFIFDMKVIGNLFTETGDGSQLAGINVSSTEGIEIWNNIFVNTRRNQYGSLQAIHLAFPGKYPHNGDNGCPPEGCTWQPVVNADIRNNTFYNWEQHFLDISEGLEYDDIALHRNIIQNSLTQNFPVTFIRHNSPIDTLGFYNLSLGGGGAFESFIAEARQQSRYGPLPVNWREEYTAQAVIEFFHEGFKPRDLGYPPEGYYGAVEY